METSITRNILKQLIPITKKKAKKKATARVFKPVVNLPASSPASKNEFRETERAIQKCQETFMDLQILHINKFSNSFIQSSLSALLNIANSCQIYSDK